MKLQRSERDYYALKPEYTPPLDGTWQASFDSGGTWTNGTLTDGWWTWLLAGPDFDAAAVGEDPSDTQATIYETTTPLLRLADDPVLKVESGPVITVT